MNLYFAETYFIKNLFLKFQKNAVKVFCFSNLATYLHYYSILSKHFSYFNDTNLLYSNFPINDSFICPKDVTF